MKENKTIVIFVLVVVAAVVSGTVISIAISGSSAKKDFATIYLTEKDDGKTISLDKGDVLNLELKDYGDGGYAWEIVKLDEQVINLTKRFDSETSGLMGDFGSDIWVFNAEKAGSTTLGLECSRPWDKTDVCATFTVQIEVQ
jgi:predicted secreted protein